MSVGSLGKTYRDGEVIVRKGEVGDCMFVIQKGKVQVLDETDGRETLLRVLGEGEIIGEIAMFEKEPRSATVRALGEVRVLTVDRKNFLRRVSEDPTIAFRVVQVLAGRVRALTEELVRVRDGKS